MATFMYNSGVKGIIDRSIDYASDVIKIALVDATYTPDRDDNDMGDIGTGEILATNYVPGFAGAGRKTLANKVITQDNAADTVFLDETDDITWTSLGGAVDDTVTGAILYKHLTSDALSVLIAYFDLQDTPTNGHDFVLHPDDAGLCVFDTDPP